MGLQDGLRIFGEQAHVGEGNFPRADAPADEQLAQGEKEKQVLEILNGKRIGKVRRFAIEQELRGAAAGIERAG